MARQLTKAVRGDTLKFSGFNFYDEDGNTFTPDSVTVTVEYPLCGCRQKATVDLTLSGSTWIGTWASGISDAGDVDISVLAENSTVSKVIDVRITLTANKANCRVTA